MRCEEAQELITGMVDSELSAQESLLITAHLGDCPDCPRVYAFELSLKHALREMAKSIHVPTALKEKVLRDQRPALGKRWLRRLWIEPPRMARLVAQGGAIAALIVLSVMTARYWLATPRFPIVPGVFESYSQIARGRINPIETRTLPELKKHLTKSVNGKFAPVAYDLSAMNLQLVGRLVQEIANRNVLVAVYQGPNSMLICYTFLGSEDDAPAGAKIFFDFEKRMNFYQFVYAKTNAVMHREGQVMCILVSPIPMDRLLAIARSKAHTS